MSNMLRDNINCLDYGKDVIMKFCSYSRRENIDVTANFFINDEFTLGSAYRCDNALIALTGYSYNCDTAFGSYNSDSYELFKHFEFGRFNILIVNPCFF